MSRIDVYLVQKGFTESRSLAAALIRSGAVSVNGKICTKPALEVAEGAEISLAESPLTRYVSRGGLKLEAALEAWGYDPKGRVCADIGSSTGGFTDCLLQRGAAKVYAVDSGSDQLHPSLRERSEVVVMENVNARHLTREDLEAVDLAVMDVSFISQTLLYPAVMRILKEDGVFISLIKPQFEVGKAHLGGGGIVRSRAAREAVPKKIAEAAEKNGLKLEKTMLSPIQGGDGNVEYLAYFTRKNRKGSP
ncbi:MAG: TlyA family RNA methyltransferase [Clostridia bacterium]|nr:TlyA family RNA methyltransferase [Clostridia bacterium]